MRNILLAAVLGTALVTPVMAQDRFPLIPTDQRTPAQQALAAAVKARFGEQGVVDLIAVSGFYVMVSMALNVGRVSIPNGGAPPLPALAGARR